MKESSVEGTQERKFFRTTITLDLLHDQPVDFINMPFEDVASHIVDNNFYNHWTVSKVEELSREQMDRALAEVGASSDFFDSAAKDQEDRFDPETCSHQAAVQSDDGSWYCPGCESSVSFPDEDEPSVFVLMRNEDTRRCFLGVFSSKRLARDALVDDMNQYDGLYDSDNYDVIETTLDG